MSWLFYHCTQFLKEHKWTKPINMNNNSNGEDSIGSRSLLPLLNFPAHVCMANQRRVAGMGFGGRSIMSSSESAGISNLLGRDDEEGTDTGLQAMAVQGADYCRAMGWKGGN